MGEARLYDQFFDLVARGGPRELKMIEKCLDLDPKSNFYSRSDPKHFINKKNFLLQTPIYVAAKHGNLKVVEYLLSQGAHPKLLSNISNEE